MYRLLRVVTCDAPDCPTAVIVQGADDAALKHGWVEIRRPNEPPTHRCPAHAGEVVANTPAAPIS